MKKHHLLAIAALAGLPACGSGPIWNGDPGYSQTAYPEDPGYSRYGDRNYARNDAATVAGAIGGAVVGNEIEKNHRGERNSYRVTVRFRDGREESFDMEELNGIRRGDRVRVEGGRLYRG